MIENWKALSAKGLCKLVLVPQVGKDSKGRLIGSAYSIQIENTPYKPDGEKGEKQIIPVDQGAVESKIAALEKELEDTKDFLADVEEIATTYEPPVLDGIDPQTGKTLESLGK